MRFFSNLILSFSIFVAPTYCLAASQAASATAQGAPTADTGSVETASPSSREYHLKAAFLRYVAKYIEWPAEDVKDGNINICVLGQVPSFDGLESINGKIVNDLTILVKKILTVDESSACQLVFVTNTENDKLSNIISKLQKKPILSFGDMPGFAEKGGAMNFYIANNRLAIMVNLPTVGEANLKVNPQMLRLVTIVPT